MEVGVVTPPVGGTGDGWRRVGGELRVLAGAVRLVIAKIPSELGEAPVRAASDVDSTDNTGVFLAGRLKADLPTELRHATVVGRKCRPAERCVSPMACAYLASAWKSTMACVAR